MLKKVPHNLIMAVIFLLLTLGQQYSFYALKGIPIVWLSPGKYLTLFAFFLFFSFTKGSRTRFLILNVIILLNFFQMAHLSYFGTQVLPAELYLVFTQVHEIVGTLKEELSHIIIPFFFTLIPMAIGWFSMKYFNKIYEIPKAVPILLVLYGLYNPLRTYFTGNTWGRQPSTRELAGMNVYLTSSYFLGKILPHKLGERHDKHISNTSLKLEIEKFTKSPWQNIIVVLGESLTPNHMSLFDYKPKTTPFLETLKKSKNFFYTKGLASGVSTDISVAFFLNMGFGSVGAIKAARGEHCLFKFAKDNHFSTHFLSVQSGEQLRYIAPYLCSSALDDYRSLENISPKTEDPNAAIDRHLLPVLRDLLARDKKHFIILHQRGSHAPWNLRYTKEAAKFESFDDPRISDYDNSVVEFDLFWKEMNKIISKSKTKTLVVYLSDHGEALGEKGKWGHGFLDRTAFEVPIMIQSFNRKLPRRTKRLPIYLTHYNLSLYIANQLGAVTNQKPATILKDFVIYGNDIDGFAGKASIHFGPFNRYKVKRIP